MRWRRDLPRGLALGAGIVLIGLIVGGALSERLAEGPPSTVVGSPSATAAASVPPSPGRTNPSPSSSPTAPVLNDRFGFIWVDEPRGLRVTPETGQGGLQVGALGWEFSYCSCAVSPDRTRILYWTSRIPGTAEMRIVEVARSSQQATIYRAADDQRISGATWSSDGTGILFSLEGVNAPGGPPGGPPNSALLVIEASGGTARKLVGANVGSPVYVPLGWDRAAGVAAAGLSGEGGYMFGYLVVRTAGDPAPRTERISDGIYMLSVDVSSDQRFALGVFFDQTGSMLRWWRLGDFGTIQSGPRLGDRVRPKWRSAASEIGWVEGGVLQLLDVERGTRRTGGVFPAPDYVLSAFRSDGSAALGESGSGPTTFVLLEIASGRTERVTPGGSMVSGAVRFP